MGTKKVERRGEIMLEVDYGRAEGNTCDVYIISVLQNS